MGQYRSIYDSYRLSNSSAIPLYQGSAAPEALAVGQHQEGIYDAALAGALGTGAGLDSIQGMDKDNPHILELRSRVQAKLSEFAKRGDYENMLPAVQQLAGEFSARANELYSSKKNFLDWNTQLDSKDYNLTPDQKAGLRADALARYKGMSKDASGRYVGAFQGPDIAANVNKPEWVDKVMKDVVIRKHGTSGNFADNGEFIINYGDRTETLTRDQIEAVINQAYSMDQGLQADLDQSARIAGSRGPSLQEDQWTPYGRQKIQEYTTAGYSPEEAKQRAAYDMEHSRLKNSLTGYGMDKYETNNRWEDVSLHAKPSASIPKEPESIHVVLPGPAAKLNADEYEHDKIRANLTDYTTQLSSLDKQIANNQRLLEVADAKGGDGTEYTILKAKAAELQKQRDIADMGQKRAQSILDYSNHRTASEMNTTYEDYLKTNSATLTKQLTQITGGKSWTTQGGTTVTPQDMSEAIMEGRVRMNTTKEYSASGSSVGSMVPRVSSLTVTTRDGKQVSLGKNNHAMEVLSTIHQFQRDKNPKIVAFEKRRQDNLTSGVGQRALESSIVNLAPKEKELMDNILNVSGGANYDFSMSGDYTRKLKSTDIPAGGWKSTGINTLSPNGTVMVEVQGIDEEGKVIKGGNRTVYIPSASLARYFGTAWMKQNKLGEYPEVGAAAEAILPGRNGELSGTAKLSTGSPGVVEELGQVNVGGKTFGNVRLMINGDSYDIVDEHNKAITIRVPVTQPDGTTKMVDKPMATLSHLEAGKWMDYMKKGGQ